MRVIGVVDMRGGRAVRACAGRRDDYQPIGDAADLARTYVDRYKLAELYVADLDAIEAVEVARPFQGRDPGGPERAALQTIRQIADIGVPLWLDAGVSTVEDARGALAHGATHVVVGLETLPSFEVLEQICDAVGGQRVAFSLDLRDSEPILANHAMPREAPHHLAARAVIAGAGAIVVIDLGRVGTRSGLDVELIGRVRHAAPGVMLCAGGGIRGGEDLARLAEAGCDGALVATAVEEIYRTSMR